MFTKILIANRGEIAVRVARSAQRLGIRCVAVYSIADRDALHVEVCDEAFCIGGAAASESYLNGDRIIALARDCGAEAIHPGYGFLSENAAFARACEAEGIVFIGPSAAAIETMGSKTEAKAIMASAGVPLVPGYHGDDQDDEQLARESRSIGFPQLIKASAGGGGKGMRLVEAQQAFAAALVSARREAATAFADDKVLIERYLLHPRHVEMQIFADTHGNCVHLFERDCSIQRRHQKVLEEAPAPGLGHELRTRMGDAAISCARSIGYVGAGTVEFLLDSDGAFYFMEMNTRLQVEHPVTEMITGLDLVEWQLRVAVGEKLPLKQSQLTIEGHAIEVRVYAESPQRDFMPASGQIGFLQLPQLSEGVRIDTGVRCDDFIGIHYDPMIAKLIVHGADRASALARLGLALRQYQILGINTNLGFLGALASSPEFAAGEFDTGFIETHRQALFERDERNFQRALLLAATSMLPAFAGRNPVGMSPWDASDLWRMNLASSQLVSLVHEDSTHTIRAIAEPQSWRLELDGKSCQVAGEWISDQQLRLEIDAEIIVLPVLRKQDSISLCYQGQSYYFEIPRIIHGDDTAASSASHPCAPMSGAVVALPLAVGDTVEPGDILVVIEAMKMEHAIVSQLNARVSEILVAAGDQVDEGETLVLLEAE